MPNAVMPLRPGYRVQTAETETELTLYGEIVAQRPVDWWTDEPIPGDFIVQSEILQDLETAVKAGVKKIRLRINSVGGDAGVALTIHNRLREYAKNGVRISCIVDGLAASGGSLIMCAADDVEIHPSSLVMIHNCWSFIFGPYNAADLRAAAERNDAWDAAQMEIYTRKTGLSAAVIRHMMAETTYMTGREAVEKGFADRLLEEDGMTVAACADRKALIVGGHRVQLPRGMRAPDGIAIENTSVSTGRPADIDRTPPSGEKGGIQMATNLNELRDENPALAAQVEADVRATLTDEQTSAVETAVRAERDRLAAIDEISHLFDGETVREAKYGAVPMTAEKMAFAAAKKAAAAGSAFLTGLAEDSKAAEGGGRPVGAAVNEPETPKVKTEEERYEDAKNVIHELLHGGKDND